MLRSWMMAFVVSFAAVGCAPRTLVSPIPIDHPASPQAPEATQAALTTALQVEPQDAVNTRPPGSRVPTMEHEGHSMGTDSRASEPGHGAHPRAQEVKPETAEPESRPDSGVTYSCPMHPEIVRKKPGTCPKCGMTLVKRKEDPK